MQGFSPRSIWRMRAFYLAYTEEVRNLPQAAADFDGENMPRIADLRMVQEPLEDGVAGILFLGRAHVTASR